MCARELPASSQAAPAARVTSAAGARGRIYLPEHERGREPRPRITSAARVEDDDDDDDGPHGRPGSDKSQICGFNAALINE